jgi:hypothetical protein
MVFKIRISILSYFFNGKKPSYAIHLIHTGYNQRWARIDAF